MPSVKVEPVLQVNEREEGILFNRNSSFRRGRGEEIFVVEEEEISKEQLRNQNRDLLMQVSVLRKLTNQITWQTTLISHSS